MRIDISAKKEGMTTFLDELQKTRVRNELHNRHRNSRSFKTETIRQEKESAKENVLKNLFFSIYKNALPVDPSYKNSCKKELNDGLFHFMKDRAPKGIMTYFSEAKKKGCRPAELMLEATEEFVDRYFRKFYETLDETAAEDLTMDMDNPEVELELEGISTKLNHDEISNIIADNVKKTVKHEIEKTKEEDNRIKEVEDSLAKDPDTMTESAIERALARAGIKEIVYEPSLFDGIMINKLHYIGENGDALDEDHMKKKAFFESVKEMTKLATLQVLGLEKISDARYRNLANRYARLKVPSSAFIEMGDNREEVDI